MTDSASLTLKASHRCFDGMQHVYSHHSKALNCTMHFGIYLPTLKSLNQPVLYWLSGLTCTHENFMTKACAQRIASELGVIIVTPDTSPRSVNVEGEDDADDFGSGAGFYVDATINPWQKHYRMYSYITKELPSLITTHFPADKQRSGIFGHSMGGHGALTIALKNPDYFKTVSAFAPICSPMNCSWGKKAFKGYLGDNEAHWQEYDACQLISARGWKGSPILIDQGTNDPFINTQLKPELLQLACAQANVPLIINMRQGYDHSYFFIATFIESHLRYHMKYLGKNSILITPQEANSP